MRDCLPAIKFPLALITLLILAFHIQAQDVQPVIVRPGAPGESTKTLPSTTRAALPPRSANDIEFMQGMIMHHAQAVEMTAMIVERTQNKEICLLGARISQSQSDEMNFMKRWLVNRGEPASAPTPSMADSHSHGGHSSTQMKMTMPGMLTYEQMAELKKAEGADFDRLFLSGMIQHHIGALVMVKELHDTAGAGQDAEIFNFTTDVDSGQRAEIKIMQTMLRKKN